MAFGIGALEIGGVAVELIAGGEFELDFVAAVPIRRALHAAQAGGNVFEQVDEADGLAQGVGDVGDVFILGGGEDAAAGSVGELLEIAGTAALSGADDVGVGFDGEGIAAAAGADLDLGTLVVHGIEEALLDLGGRRNDAEDRNVGFLEKPPDVFHAIAAVRVAAIGDENDGGVLLVDRVHPGIGDGEIDGIEERGAAFLAVGDGEDAVFALDLDLAPGFDGVIQDERGPTGETEDGELVAGAGLGFAIGIRREDGGGGVADEGKPVGDAFAVVHGEREGNGDAFVGEKADFLLDAVVEDAEVALFEFGSGGALFIEDDDRELDEFGFRFDDGAGLWRALLRGAGMEGGAWRKGERKEGSEQNERPMHP